MTRSPQYPFNAERKAGMLQINQLLRSFDPTRRGDRIQVHRLRGGLYTKFSCYSTLCWWMYAKRTSLD